MKHEALIYRVAIRYAASQLPGVLTPVHLDIPQVNGFSTFVEEKGNDGGRPHPNDREFRDNSMHDVMFADDLAKEQDRIVDEIDYSGYRIQYNRPSVPQNVRR